MTLPWIQKYQEAKNLVEISNDYLRVQDVVSAVVQLETAVNLYKEILEIPDLIPNAKKLVQDKLQHEQDKLKILRRIVRRKIKLEIEKVPPKNLKYTSNRKQK